MNKETGDYDLSDYILPKRRCFNPNSGTILGEYQKLDRLQGIKRVTPLQEDECE